MKLHDQLELENTRHKLRLLEERYQASARDNSDRHVRDLSLRSLKRIINQLKEEIARFEAHTSQPERAPSVR